MGSNERVLFGNRDPWHILGKEKKLEEMKEEVIEDKIFKEYIQGVQGRVRIRNLGKKGKGLKNPT